ncbi:MAG: FtsX-like permease family protein [Bacteroidota bacterium]
MNRLQPPRWASRFLGWFCDEALLEEIQGDLEEAFYHRCQSLGPQQARQQYITDVFSFFKPYAFEKYSRVKQFVPMLDHRIKIALRNILHHKRFTFINAVGLVVGISAIVLISLYLNYEYTFDKMVPQYERTYRLVNHYRDQVYSCMKFPSYYNSEGDDQMALLRHLGNYPAVEKACHFVPTQTAIGGGGRFFANLDEQQFELENILFTNTGTAFHDLFPQRFLLGDPGDALADYSSLILSESLSERWFGKDWAKRRILGKEVRIMNEPFIIKAVVEDAPANSHFDFELILLQKNIPSWAAYTYIQLDEKNDIDQFMQQLNADVDLFYPGYTEDVLSKGIQAVSLADIHFTDDMLYEIKEVANKNYLSTFAIVALIILLIIWTNYTNLSVAMYADRQREIGMRKVLGARSQDVAGQLLLEAVALALLCLPFILALTFFALPAFNELMGSQIPTGQLFSISSLLLLILLLVLTGLISGLYPALVYSWRKTLHLFGQGAEKRLVSRYFNFRNGLITLQFFLVVGLLSMTYFIYQQMQFIEQRDLGFIKEDILYFGIDGAEKYEQLKSQLSAIPEIQAVGAGGIPGSDMYNQLTYKMKDTEVTLSDGTQQYIGLDAVRTLELDCPACEKLEAGKERIFVINRTAAEKLAKIKGVAPEELIGDILVTEPEWENEEYGYGVHETIDGIIDDYKYFSLKYPNQSLLVSIYRQSPWVYEMMVRANTQDWSKTIKDVKRVYSSVESERPFVPNFLEDRLNQLYESEARSGKLLAILGIVAIVLAMMGLAGVVAFLAYRRQKEIGIRKVLGASVGNILLRFQQEFGLLLLLAVVLAVPISLLLASHWLAGFAYHIQPQIWVVLGAGLAVLILVVIVVSVQAHRAASRPPMEVLRVNG